MLINVKIQNATNGTIHRFFCDHKAVFFCYHVAMEILEQQKTHIIEASPQLHKRSHVLAPAAYYCCYDDIRVSHRLLPTGPLKPLESPLETTIGEDLEVVLNRSMPVGVCVHAYYMQLSGDLKNSFKRHVQNLHI